MVQLTILSGKMAGASWAARRFPIRIGRAATAELRLEDDGVWDQHLVLELDREGFVLKVLPNALARVNGQPASEARLRNGDTIEVGVVRLRFWLAATRQRRLRSRELFSWIMIGAVLLSQIALLYWLLR